jgi:hypothetical protein
MGLALQFLGALGILVPFALFQLGRMSQHGYVYLALNLVGSTVLTAVAYLDGQRGFVILQGVWSLAAAAGIGRRLLRERASTRPHDGT